MRIPVRPFATLLAGLMVTLPLAAATWQVGPGGEPLRLADALRRAGDGDLILVAPGDYHADVGVIRQKRLTIRGVGARPIFHADGASAEDKAQLVVRDGEITIENLAFTGTRVPHGNGAGIRFERGHLTLRRCAFFDNEMGVLTANFDDARLTVEDSEFGQAPGVPGQLEHLLYIGRIAEATIRGSRFSQGSFGHLLKSRARRTTIEYNLIADGPRGQASYEIDLPNGGAVRLVGNLIQKSAQPQNLALVAFGAEGAPWPDSALVMAHNTLVNDAGADADFLRAWPERLPASASVHLVNNLAVGRGRLVSPLPGTDAGNVPLTKDALVDADGLDFALVPASPWRGRGVVPRLDDGTVVAPRAEFRLPAGTRALAPPPAWSPGAIQR